MTINFKISESLEQIIEQISNDLPGKWESANQDNGQIWLVDENFSSWAECTIWPSNSGLSIVTAWSQFEYEITPLQDEDGCNVKYVGAYRALLEQNLLPHMTPEFTGYEEVFSSLKPIVLLKEYIELQDDFAMWRKSKKALNTHPHPLAISEYLKQRFIDSFAPAQEDGAHPDHCAVKIDDNPEWMGWVDRREEWNSHVLQPGTWLFPSGEIVQLT